MRGIRRLTALLDRQWPAPVRRWMYLRRKLHNGEPLSRNFGWERGTPVDRLYIERFLEDHRDDIRGRVLEIGDDAYSRKFGGDRITHQSVLNYDPNARHTTITGDLADPSVLPTEAFDCIVLTQTLHLLFDVHAAVDQLQRSLVPGGVLLMTVPGISPIDPHEWRNTWHWSLTEHSVSRLMNEHFGDDFSVIHYGNLFAATAFLHGAVLEEIDVSKLEPADPVYPVVVAARARKPAAGTA